MRLRKSTAALFLLIFFVSMAGLFMMMQAEIEGSEKSAMAVISPVESEIGEINDRVRKLEDEMQGNVKMMGNIKSKLELLIKIDDAEGAQKADPQIDLPPVGKPNEDQSKVLDFVPHPEAARTSDLECPATVPYLATNADWSMDTLVEQWDFKDVDGGVWKQGWDVKTNDGEWAETRLKVILMPHSHNDPGWVKTLDVYYEGQTKHILNTVVDALTGHSNRRFIWAETIFLNMWFDDPSVTSSRKENFKTLLAAGQIEIVTGGWVMTEEAPTHYFAMMDQLIEGHQWLKKHLDYHPRSGYNCDTFGATPTTAYLNHLAGVDHMLIQRTHYIVKKHFAKEKLLEFNWRQSFDSSGADQTFTHMMPFYSYDVPHTCGPEPAVCCQFDFRRLRGQSPAISCPWGKAPIPITAQNVRERAKTLLDQYRKKAKLYAKGTEQNTHVVLTLLGDDFRWDSKAEADAQFGNYEKLFDYINNAPELNAEVKFGTLADYFSLVEQARPRSKAPSVTGDFFSYSDRVDNYWTGFFNSRAFYKWFDRYLEHWVQATDTAMSLALLKKRGESSQVSAIFDKIKGATRTLDLFQHHDAITGTEKDFVVKDYGERLFRAVNKIQTAYAEVMTLLNGEADVKVEILSDELKARGRIPQAKTISLVDGCRVVDVFNSLLHETVEVIRLKASGSRFITAAYADGTAVIGQVSPWWDVEGADNKFEPDIQSDEVVELALAVKVAGLSVARLHICGQSAASAATQPIATVELHSGASSTNLRSFGPMTKEEKSVEIHNEGIRLQLNPRNGLLQSTLTSFDNAEMEKLGIQTTGKRTEMSFAKYSTRGRGNSQDRSGAYLFMPDGPSKSVFGGDDSSPFRIVRGRLINEVHVLNPRILQRLSLFSAGLSSEAVSVENWVDVRGESNYELVMKIQTDIPNNVLFTDLNGLSIARKPYYDKLHIQGNVYPIVTAGYLEDMTHRFTVLTKQASGVTAQKAGQIEVWLDRTLAQDDARGLGQPVVDNVLTKCEFKLLLEKRKTTEKQPSIYLSPLANRLVEFMHSPVIPSLLSAVTRNPGFTGLNSRNIPYDAKLVNLRPTRVNGAVNPTPALILRRYGSDCNFHSSQSIENNIPWPISPKALLGIDKLTETSLTLLDVKSENVREIELEPMKIKVFHVLG